MSTKFAPAKLQSLSKQRALSETTTRVLRAIVERGSTDDWRPLLEAAGGNERRLFDALIVLERRWLITWAEHGRDIRARKRGETLLTFAAYRDRGLLS